MILREFDSSQGFLTVLICFFIVAWNEYYLCSGMFTSDCSWKKYLISIELPKTQRLWFQEKNVIHFPSLIHSGLVLGMDFHKHFQNVAFRKIQAEEQLEKDRPLNYKFHEFQILLTSASIGFSNLSTGELIVTQFIKTPWKAQNASCHMFSLQFGSINIILLLPKNLEKWSGPNRSI